MRCLVVALLFTPNLACAEAKSREAKVRQDRATVESKGFWIYNDLAKGFAEARQSNKPILVVMRCIPCEECVKLDDDLVDQDPVLRPLMEQFVCVRQVSTNGLDLATFQFDTDQSFAVFLLNADGTIYGRFGTRSHRTDWVGDVSLRGLAKALERGLALHADYPANREALAGKRGPEPEFASPERYPSLRDRYKATLNYEGNVVQSCIHCHQIGDAQRESYRSSGRSIPVSVLYPYPHPKSIGLTLDSRQCATVSEVSDNSEASQAGFAAGDVIESMNAQPLLSIADVQWVLHSIPASGGKVECVVRRGDQTKTLSLELADGWRTKGDLSWRVTTWGLRRMVLGGLVLESLSNDDRNRLKLPPGSMALRVQQVGLYGAHAAGKQAGVQKGDIVVGYGGRSDLMREADVIAHGIATKKIGDSVDLDLLRDGKRRKVTLPIQP